MHYLNLASLLLLPKYQECPPVIATIRSYPTSFQRPPRGNYQQ